MKKKILKKINYFLLIVLIIFNLSGCAKNNKRYNFYSLGKINAFLNDALTIEKTQIIKDKTITIMTLYNNSDYYINNISLRIKTIDECICFPEKLSMRPQTKTKIYFESFDSNDINWNKVQFLIADKNLDFNSNHQYFTLEPLPNIVYATDLTISVKPMKNLGYFKVKIQNNKNEILTINSSYITIINNDGDKDHVYSKGDMLTLSSNEEIEIIQNTYWDKFLPITYPIFMGCDQNEEYDL